MPALYRTLGLRYLRQRWPRALLIVVSIALGVATWVTTGSLNHSLEHAIKQSATPLAGLADLYVSNGDFGVPHRMADQIRRFPEVRFVQKLVISTVQVDLPGAENQQRRLEAALLLGIDFDALNKETSSAWGVRVSEGAVLKYGAAKVARLFNKSRPQPVLVGRKLYQSLQNNADLRVLAAGREQVLQSTGAIDAQGPAATLGGNVLVMDYLTAAELLEQGGRVTRLDVLLQPGTDRQAVKRRIEMEPAAGQLASMMTASVHNSFPANLPWCGMVHRAAAARVHTSDKFDKPIQDILSGLKMAFALCGAGALVIGIFLVYNSLAVSVAERQHDIGILRSMGATKRQIGCLFMSEALTLGLIGSLLGIPAGLMLTGAVLGILREAICDMFLPIQQHHVDFKVGSLIMAVIAGMVTTMLAALVPTIQATSREASEALRRFPLASNTFYRTLHVAGCVILALAGSLMILLKHTLPPMAGSCGGLALITLSVLMATPLLSSLMARFLQPAARTCFGVAERLASDNLLRSPGRTGLVIAAVSLGVAQMVLIAGVIRSSTEAVPRWLDASVTADLFVTSGGPFSANGQTVLMKESVLDELKDEFPGLRVLPVTFKWTAWEHGGRDTVILLAVLDARTYCEVNQARYPATPKLQIFQRLSAEPETAIVSENFSMLYGVRVGDSITLPGADGLVPLKVIGTLTDYSWNRGAVLVHRSEQNVRMFDAEKASVLDVYRPEAVSDETVRQRVQQSAWGTRHALFATTRSELRRHVDNIFIRISSILYALVVMVGTVASLGIVSALLISIMQRRRELGILRATGATRRQVLRSVLAEAVLMGAIGAMIGLMVGGVLQWYVVRHIVLDETGFCFPVVIPWSEAAVLAVMAVGAATVAGLGPAWRAVSMRIAEAIAYE